MGSRRIPLVGVRGMTFTPAMRMAAIGLVLLCTVGLGWRGVVIYRADQRAEQAAALAKGAPGQVELPGLAPPATQPAPAPAPAPEKQVTESSKAEPPVKPKLWVHVEGAVRNPGVYSFEEGARVNDAILAAGGPLPDGVPGALNLAAPLTDGAKVYVYKAEELKAQPGPAAQEASFTPVQAAAAAPAPKPAAQASAAKQPVLVNINTASATELEAVPGIGPVTAQAIIAYRTQNGPFRQVDDLTAVKGIGAKTLEKMRPYVRI